MPVKSFTFVLVKKSLVSLHSRRNSLCEQNYLHLNVPHSSIRWWAQARNEKETKRRRTGSYIVLWPIALHQRFIFFSNCSKQTFNFGHNYVCDRKFIFLIVTVNIIPFFHRFFQALAVKSRLFLSSLNIFVAGAIWSVASNHGNARETWKLQWIKRERL